MKNSGFSLVELSIALVVIGLITAGIIGGQALIKTAQLHDVIKDVSHYKTAINTFRTQYDAYPGDLSNASTYWAAAGNGNGNGLIEASNTEQYKAWHHLYLADLVGNSYDGTSQEALSKFPGTVYYRLETETSAIYGVTASTVNSLGSYASGGWANVISPIDAYGIDSKIDDGTPSKGNVLSIYYPASAAGTNCAINSTTGLTADYTAYSGATTYQATQTSNSCIMFFYGF